MIVTSAAFVAFAFIGSSLAAGGSDSWSYERHNGPDTWPAKFCSGLHQSPINLDSTSARPTYNKPLEFSSAYRQPIRGSLSSNGQTLEFSPHDGSKLAISGASLGYRRYEVVQFHFHWGSSNVKGSEHTINGQSFPLEMHVVHKNVKYRTLAEALKKKDGLLVLGFLFNVPYHRYGHSGVFKPLNKIEEGISIILNSLDQFSTDVDASVNLGDFLQAVDQNNFYVYSGSLTTPPCNEVVLWVVFDQPITIGKNQVSVFRQLESKDGGRLVDNFRPPQPLYHRQLFHHRSKSVTSLVEHDYSTSSQNDYSYS